MTDFHPNLNSLISQIYDTALEPALWPKLLEQLIEAITTEKKRDLSAKQAAIEQQSVLLNHLQRSVKMSEHLQGEDEQCYFERMLLQQLPFPILVVSTDGKLLQKNQHAQTFLAGKNLLSIQNERLCMASHARQKEFNLLLAKLAKPNPQQTQYSMRLSDKYKSTPATLNMSLISDQYQLKGNILVLIASYDPAQRPDLVSITAHFSLTPAEARLLEKLVSTKTLHQIADEHQVSIHTVRCQLKSVLKKTGCHRQSELIKLIINAPLMPDISQHPPLLALSNLSAPCYHHRITLRDGRQLGYADVGLRSGLPLLFLHPTTGSRLQQHPDQTILFENKMRLITPDRPGFGLSDSKPDLTLLNYADDLYELIEQLNIDQLVLVAYCGGAPYALASAVKLKNRVLHTVLISPVSPYQEINLFYGVKSSNKLLAKLALNFPNAIHPLLTLMARSLLTDPARYFDQVYDHLCESDAAALSEPEVTDNILLALREAMRQGTQAFSHDLHLISNAWGIDFSSVTQPISIWHGTADQHVPINLVRQLHHSLGNASLHEITDHGHLMIYYFWRDILNAIKDEHLSMEIAM